MGVKITELPTTSVNEADYIPVANTTSGTRKVLMEDVLNQARPALDTALSPTSENAVQNKAIAEAVNTVSVGLANAQNDIDDLKSALAQGTGLTSAAKAALLACLRNVAWIGDDGQDYYDDLYDALYAITAIWLNTNSIQLTSIGATSQLTATTMPEGGSVTWASSDTSVATVSSAGLVTAIAYGSATITATAGSVSATCSVVVAQATVTSISATYTPTGTVYDTDSLDSLKSDLVVTATWSNGTTSTLTDSDYVLSGTLTTGTSTVTVSYAGQTTTFTVTVVGLSSISAVYTQSGTVYTTDTLDSLKDDLVVTATYSDSSTAVIPAANYTLSGTLAEGTSTITVSYGGKTSTFSVVVSTFATLNNFIDVSQKTPVAGYINDNGEVAQIANAYFIDEFYPIDSVMFVQNGSGTKKTIVSPTTSAVYRIAFYDSNKQFIGRTYVNSGDAPVTPQTPSGAQYMKIGWSGATAFTPDYILVADVLDDTLYPNSGFINSNNELEIDPVNAISTTDYLTIDNYDTFAITPYGSAQGAVSRIVFYDSSKALLSRFFYSGVLSGSVFTGSVPQGAVYYRMTKPEGETGFNMVFVEG